MRFPQLCPMQDPSDLGQARRMATALCKALGFDEVAGAEVLLVVAELGTNLLKHTAGAGGELVFAPLEQAGGWGLDILALDAGPGIPPLTPFFSEPHEDSSARSKYLGPGLGVGLGAVRRLSTEFDCYSQLGQGTVVFSRRWQQPPAPSRLGRVLVGAVCLPMPGQTQCGDAWAMQVGSEATLLMLADGLGHGPNAAQAGNLAVCLFKQYAPSRPEALLNQIHCHLHPQAAAVAVVELSLAHRRLTYAGLGNIAGRLLCGDASLGLVSHPGSAGFAAVSMQPFSYDWPVEDGLLILHSDGLDSHWSLTNYPGLAAKHPAAIAGVLYRDHRKPQDDCSVLVAKVVAGQTAVAEVTL